MVHRPPSFAEPPNAVDSSSASSEDTTTAEDAALLSRNEEGRTLYSLRESVCDAAAGLEAGPLLVDAEMSCSSAAAACAAASAMALVRGAMTTSVSVLSLTARANDESGCDGARTSCVGGVQDSKENGALPSAQSQAKKRREKKTTRTNFEAADGPALPAYMHGNNHARLCSPDLAQHVALHIVGIEAEHLPVVGREWCDIDARGRRQGGRS